MKINNILIAFILLLSLLSIKSIGQVTPPIGPLLCYTLENYSPLGGSTAKLVVSTSNTKVSQQIYTDTLSQKWSFEKINGYYRIKNRSTGFFLQVKGVNIVVGSFESPGAEWTIETNTLLRTFNVKHRSGNYMTRKSNGTYRLAPLSLLIDQDQQFNIVHKECSTEIPNPLKLNVPEDTTVYLQAIRCNPTIVCDTLLSNLGNATATGCDQNISIKSVILGSTDTGGTSFVRRYALGLTSILVIASDGCGNVARDTLNVAVKDTIKPCVISKKANFYMNDQGVVRLNAKQHDGGSYDNCIGASELKFSWTKNVNDTILIVDCNNVRILHDGGDIILANVDVIPFEINLNLFVTDASGNQDTALGNRFIAFFDLLDVCHKTPLIISPGDLSTLPPTTSGKRIENVFNLNVFPNPNSGEFMIRVDNLDLRESAVLSIYSILGQKVYSQKLTSSDPIKIDLSNDNSNRGLYIINVKSGNENKQKKFIIK